MSSAGGDVHEVINGYSKTAGRDSCSSHSEHEAFRI